MSAHAVKTKAKTRSKSSPNRGHSGFANSAFSSSAPSHSSNQQLSAFYSAGPAVGLVSPVQAKFTIGKSNDPYEREADSVADSIVCGGKAPPITPVPAGDLGSVAKLELAEDEQDQNPPQTQLLQRLEEEKTEEPPPTQPYLIHRQTIENGSEEEEPEETTPQTFLIQRETVEEEEPEDTLPQTKLIQTQAIEDDVEEEPEETTPQTFLIQRETLEEEEPKPQLKLLQTSNCPECSNSQSDSEEDKLVQRLVEKNSEPDETGLQAQQHPSSSMSGSASRVSSISSATDNAGAGEPLKPAMRNEMESGLGVDLRDVRVHGDGASFGAANALKAKAFTHGSDIWLGSGQSKDDKRLMAHELTHVVQQNSGQGGLQTIQCKPSDYRHPEDGGGVSSRLRNRFDEEIDESEAEEGAGAETEAQGRSREVDRSELRDKSDEVKSDTKPDVDRPAAEKPGVDQAAQQVEQEADTPGEPLVEEEQPEAPAEEEGAEKEPISVAEQAAALANEAFAAADSQPEPGPQMAVVPPEPVTPVDSEGAPLAGNPETDAQVADLAERAQMLRDGGARLRAQAAEERGNAQILRGNLEKVSGEIGKAEEGITKSQTNSEYRQQLKGQAEEALSASEEKAAMVAEQAPDFTSKADEGKEDTGPMSQEASDMAAQNTENTPEDPEAAAKSREQGQKINSTGSDAATMDDAVGQTREKAGSLAEDATRAAEMNTQSQEKITETEEKLTETDARLEQMTGEANEAKTQVEGLSRAPNQVTEQANQLDQRGLALIAASFELENRLRNVERSYEQGTRSVPPLRPWEGEEGEGGEAPGSEESLLQTQPEVSEEGPGIEEETEMTSSDQSFPEAVLEGYLDPNEGRYEEREQVNVGEVLPGWLTGIDPASEQAQEEATEKENQRRHGKRSLRGSGCRRQDGYCPSLGRAELRELDF